MGNAWRLADVIELVHAEPADERQSTLFRYLLDRRHDREWPEGGYPGLELVAQNHELNAIPPAERRGRLNPEALKAAGFTWERLSGWLGGEMDAPAWEAIIPSMGYMALLRNLRNFDEKGVAESVKQAVIAKLSDPAEVAASRQLPLRFYAAWKHARGLSWAAGLEQALNLSLANVPSLSGRTLVLVDVSGSMQAPLSRRGQVLRAEVAGLFGAALALRAERADLAAFSDAVTPVSVHRGDSVLRTVDAIAAIPGGGTRTIEALLGTYAGHDRVVILTDEQAFAWGDLRGTVAGWLGLQADRAEAQAAMKQVEAIAAPIYTFNLAGYHAGHLPSGEHNRYAFGGLTDAGFAAIELIERQRDADWPF